MKKENIFSEISNFIHEHHLHVHTYDNQRPWGGFFVIEEKDASSFIDLFFPTLNKQRLLSGKLSPKILLVAPGMKLSWQYHHRRAEVWKLIQGSAAIVRSPNDELTEAQPMIINEVVELAQGERHRLVGTEDWGIVAEIWIHTNPQHPSDEEDIVRLEDDFGRK
jgi:mannose-6-phosphate isomerase